MILKLLFTALLNSALAIIIYIVDKKTAFGKIGKNKKQILFGVLFGAMAIFASTSLAGVDIGEGVITNVRDSAPICAGLIFGAPAGIIAGLIGGAYRFFSVFFGLTGEYTQIACSVSTVIAGLIAALLRKYMFDDKKPSWAYGIGVGVICEVIHMLMIFFTNMNDVVKAFSFVRAASIPMICCNAVSAGAAMLVISIISREKRKYKKSKRQISNVFQIRLFICILVAYILTSTFTYVLQSRMSDTETTTVIQKNINDVHKDITDVSDENLLKKARDIKKEYLSLKDKSADRLKDIAEVFSVAEISIIGSDGIISNSSEKKYIGFDMNSGEQSKDFMLHMGNGEEEYVQAYQPQSFEGALSRKYAAEALYNGTFLQIGYDEAEFSDDIRSTIGKISRNRHIGNRGFIIICNKRWNICSEGKYSGENLMELGVDIDPQNMSVEQTYNLEIDGERYIAAYTVAEGYYILGAIPVDEAQFMRDVSVYLSLFTEILIFSALFVLVYFLIKIIIIDNLQRVNGALSKITDGNLNVTVDVRENEEFASLSDDINLTVDTLKRYISEAEARIDAELEFAKQIQHSALPSVFPPYPNRKDFDIFAQMFTAKEVGGDFYDFYMIGGESKVAFLIADVSGKGIGAAMFMMRAKTTIKDLAESGMDVNDIFTEANKKLCENNDAGMFVTAWMAIADLKTGVISYSNAGHNPPLIKRSNGSFEYLKGRSGFVLAGLDGIKYSKNELRLLPGDMIYLYTDGVTEATNDSEQLYGEERLLNLLNSNADDSANVKMLCENVKTDVDRFVADAPQFDDMTMLAFAVKFIRGEDKLFFRPKFNSAEAVTEFAEHLTEKLNVLPQISGKVNIAIDEIYSNIVNYSGAENASISYTIEKSALKLVFEDDGIAYNPLEDAHLPDITLSADERQVGGLGIYIVKHMSKKIEYSRKDGKNILNVTLELK